MLMANNMLATKEAGRALAGALAVNSVLKELDVSGNYWYSSNKDHGDGVGFAKELAVGISANGALETITFGDNQAVTMKTVMIEADFSGRELGVSGAIIVAAFLPKCQ